MARPIVVLSVNSGSSSLKLSLDEIGATRADERRLAAGSVDAIGLGESRLALRDAAGRNLRDGASACADHPAAMHALLDALGDAGLLGDPHDTSERGAARERQPARLDAAGHRVVHGGSDHVAPERIDDALLEDLRRLTPYAPLHQPAAIACVEAVRERFPSLPQVACFDTAFHRRMPEVAERLPLPSRLWDEGVRRYGFHGLSYEWVVSELGAEALGRAVIAHLGNGASLAAVRDGRSIDTTMGFSPTGGLMMGTRSGDLDPGVLLYLLRERGMSPADVDRVVNHEAGLAGVSGTSSDMRALLAARASDARAALAVEMFCWLLRKHVGAMAAALGGMDALVFTGGIGEHAAPVREETCRGLEHLGVRLDRDRNAGHAAVISTPGSSCTVRVVAADEDRMIARHTARTLSRARDSMR
ncbi:MAG TPA: acetate/propionate family kinase [Candidatus Binatia bacterium]|nr:acetate/propionate family kinase [Candidatus Binatia bacterium]